MQRASGRSRLERIRIAHDGAAPLLTLPRGSASRHVVLALDGIEGLDPDGQDVLAAYLEESSPRLLSSTRAAFDELERTWRPDLLSLLSTVIVYAPALRERREEIPQLAEERLAILCEELGLDMHPRLGPSAAAALSAHDWPGDVTEFDAVLLAPLLAEHTPSEIEARDLGWRRADAMPAVSGAREDTVSDRAPAPIAPAPARPEADRRDPAAAPQVDALAPLESVAVELAHQLQNPLVAVKTFVSKAGGSGDAETARLRQFALDGIDRINGPLEQILQLSRLGSSTDEDLEVSGALGRAVARVAVELEDKNVRVQGIPATALPVRGAAQNLEFALVTLLRHVAETVERQSTLLISRPAADQIVLRYRADATTAHLREATGDPDSSFPLALLLVRGALIRMGGGLRASHARDEVTIELSFTAA